MEYLTDFEGTQVAFDAVTEPPSFNFPAQKWIILEKLGEESNRLTKEDITAGLGPSDSTGNGQMHICGFKRASPFDEPQQWGDINYFQYGLIQPSDSRFYWEGTPPETADWIEDVNGWIW
ncbi:hypothetical protein N7454_010501 [Penicillium verhagenii]|nr:hypothetical protein N7454_010501 [Penicillium verhagenii]